MESDTGETYHLPSLELMGVRSTWINHIILTLKFEAIINHRETNTFTRYIAHGLASLNVIPRVSVWERVIRSSLVRKI
jgi:hypothetical protein